MAASTPYYFPFTLGGATAAIVSDGPLDLGDLRNCFRDVPARTIEAMLRRHGLDPGNGLLQQNALVMRLGDQTVLFDTGMGNLAMFGPSTGRLLISLAEAGFGPEAIDAVICTHAHVDHIGGLCDDAGRPHYPNAMIHIDETDFREWTDERHIGTPLWDEIDHARKNLLPLGDRMRFIQDGSTVVPGVVAMSAPGHSVGHTCFMIESNGRRLCVLGDLLHHQVLLMERPDMQFIHDADPARAAASRMATLELLAEEGIPVLGYHFPWPGIGHVLRDGAGFRFAPIASDPGAVAAGVRL